MICVQCHRKKYKAKPPDIYVITNGFFPTKLKGGLDSTTVEKIKGE